MDPCAKHLCLYVPFFDAWVWIPKNWNLLWHSQPGAVHGHMSRAEKDRDRREKKARLDNDIEKCLEKFSLQDVIGEVHVLRATTLGILKQYSVLPPWSVSLLIC